MFLVFWMGLAGALAAPEPLRVYDALPSTLLPLYAESDADHRTAALLFSPLFYRPTLGSELASTLVETWTVATTADGPALTLHLRQGLHWADGQPITGHDICFSVAALLHPDNPVPDAADHRARLADCTVGTRDRTATVRFSRPVAEPRAWLQWSLLPAHAFAEPRIPPHHPFSRAAFGSRGRRAVLHADHVALSASGGRGALDAPMELRAGVPPDPDARRKAILVGADAASEDSRSDDRVIRRFDSRALWMVAIRREGVLADVAQRQALDARVDRPALRDAVWGTGADAPQTITGPFVHASPLYHRERDETARPPGPPLALDRVVLGVRAADAALEPRMAEALIEQLEAGGLTVERVDLPDGDRPPPEVDLLLMRWRPPPTDQVGSLLRPDGRHNPFGTHDAETLYLLGAFEQAATPDEARVAAHRLHTHLHETVHALWLTEGQVRSSWPASLPRPPLTPGTYWTELPTEGRPRR